MRPKNTKLCDAMQGCSSWQDIQGKLRRLSEKQKGDVFEELVKAYLLLEPEYASKLKHVWLHREVPQAVAKKLKLPATDQGIDLVAETNDGEFWAIQCKYRQDTDQSLTWREISTFTGLAFGVCRGISFGLICSTTERITHVLKDQERIGFCALDVWQALDADFFARLRAHLAHKPDRLEPLKPRPHQREAVKAGHQHFVTKKAKRGKLIMPCGSGKSLTAYWIAGELGRAPHRHRRAQPGPHPADAQGVAARDHGQWSGRGMDLRLQRRNGRADRARRHLGSPPGPGRSLPDRCSRDRRWLKQSQPRTHRRLHHLPKRRSPLQGGTLRPISL